MGESVSTHTTSRVPGAAPGPRPAAPRPAAVLDDLRRVPRLSVCCRVDVHDRFGPWTAVTEDVCARGCRIVTGRLPPIGSTFRMRLSSDLFPEELEVVARVAWATPERVGVAFADDPPREGAPSVAEWLQLVVEHGRPAEPGVHAVESPPRLVPAVAPAARADRARADPHAAEPGRTVIRLPRSG